MLGAAIMLHDFLGSGRCNAQGLSVSRAAIIKQPSPETWGVSGHESRAQHLCGHKRGAYLK